jgi:hypothetical protein
VEKAIGKSEQLSAGSYRLNIVEIAKSRVSVVGGSADNINKLHSNNRCDVGAAADDCLHCCRRLPDSVADLGVFGVFARLSILTTDGR